MDLGRRLTREEDGNNPGRRAVSLTCTNEFFFVTLGKGRSVAFQHAVTGASPWRVRPPRQRSGVHSRPVDARAWAGEVRGRGFLRHRKQRLYFRGRLCQADGHLRGHLLSGGQWERGRRRTSAQTGRRGGSGARRPRRRAWSGQESVWRDWNCDRANTRRPRGSASFALGEGGLRTGGWRAGRSEIRWGFLGRNARLGGKTPKAVARDS